MRRIAIVPARGGSKRIKGKNIRDFAGKPIIAYSIENAIASGLFQKVIVSTDDHKIAEVAKQYGAEVPFKRSEKNSDDFAILADVVLEVLEYYKNQNIHFDQFCCILATAPFITSEKLTKSLSLLERGYDGVFSVVRFSHPIQRGLRMDKDSGSVRMIWPENMNARSQDLEEVYHDAGQFYFMYSEAFHQQKKLFPENAGAFELTEWEAQDIDTEEDWRIAESKFGVI